MTVADAVPSTPDLVLDIPETAAALRCGRSTVYELMKSGDLVGITIGRRRLVTYRSVVEYIGRREAAARAGGDDAA